MDEVSDLVDTLTPILNQLASAKISIVPYLDQVGIRVNLLGKPAVVYYALKNSHSQQFNRQLMAAYRSHFGRNPTSRDNIQQQLNGQTLRSHALRFLTNPQKWKLVNWTYDGQTLPISASLADQSSSP